MSFDLNLNNYEKKELEEMFELPENYNESILDEKEIKLKEFIFNNNKINQDTKFKTMEFIKEAKKKLVMEIGDVVKCIKKTLADLYNTNNKLPTIDVIQETGHMVQKKSDTPYLSSFPSDIHQGVLNPLKRIVQNLTLNIDTRFREDYFNTQSTNYNFNLPIRFYNIVSMQLSNIELPTSFYTISKQLGNNFFTIKLPETNESQTITIPNGNYEYQDLMDYINNTLFNLGSNFQYINFSTNIKTGTTSGSGNVVVCINSVTYPSTQDLFAYTLDFQADKYGIEDKNSPLPLKFGWILGFRNGIYENNETYVSEGVIDLLGQKYAFLVVDDYNNNVNNSFYSAFNSSLLNKNILSRITIQSAGKFSGFSDNRLSVNTRNYYGPVDIQKIHVQLLDEYGRVMDLNNMDFSFCLILQAVYDI
jgi:hypothetical protein